MVLSRFWTSVSHSSGVPADHPGRGGRGRSGTAGRVEAPTAGGRRGSGAVVAVVVPGAVGIPWRTDYEPVPNDVCDRRAREAIGKLVPKAEKLGVSLNIENIFFNGYLMTPGEMNDFVDSFHSERVRVHFEI